MRTGLLAIALFALGCGSNTTAVTRAATLSGAEEVPPVTTTATGSATVVINADRTSVVVTLSATGFATPTTAAHIHKGPVGMNGGVIFDLAGPAFTSPATKTLTAADLKPNMGTFAENLDAIINGGTYVNVHTMANGGGEIRGQLRATTTTTAGTAANP